MQVSRGEIEDENTPLIEGNHFWASLGSASHADPTDELSAAGLALQSLAKRLGMNPKPGGKISTRIDFGKLLLD